MTYPPAEGIVGWTGRTDRPETKETEIMDALITERDEVTLRWDLTGEPDSYAVAAFAGATYFIGVDDEGDREGLWWAEVVWGSMNNPRTIDLGSEYESREDALGACTVNAAETDSDRRRYQDKLDAFKGETR